MAVLRERTLATALFARIPAQPEVDRGFIECCYEHLVLGDAATTDIKKNDFNGFYFQKQTSIDTCNFFLVKLSTMADYALNDATYGEFTDFGGYSDSVNLKTYIVDWRKVLMAHGPGQYRVRKDMTISGVAVSEISYTFNLKQYTVDNADYTFRFDVVMNGVLEDSGLNFKNTNFRTSLRSRGFFGNPDPEITQDLVVYRTKNSNTPTFFQSKNIYTLQTELLPSCITKEFGFMLFARDKWISDYNSNNHDYELIRVPVVIEGNQGNNYWSTSRNARLNYTFSDRNLNKINRNC